MAKIRFGEITIQAETPEMESSRPEMKPKLHDEDFRSLDIKAMIEKAIAELVPIPKTDQLREEINTLSQQHAALKSNVESMGADMEVEMMSLASHMEHMQETSKAPEAVIVHPEVKSITHVKDMSKEVMEQVEANKQANKADYMNHANHIVAIESALRGQKILNCILVGAVILTILSRLF